MPLLGVTPSNFEMNLISLKTRIMGLPYGEETMIVGRTMWTVHECNRQMDRQTNVENYDD